MWRWDGETAGRSPPLLLRREGAEDRAEERPRENGRFCPGPGWLWAPPWGGRFFLESSQDLKARSCAGAGPLPGDHSSNVRIPRGSQSRKCKSLGVGSAFFFSLFLSEIRLGLTAHVSIPASPGNEKQSELYARTHHPPTPGLPDSLLPSVASSFPVSPPCWHPGLSHDATAGKGGSVGLQLSLLSLASNVATCPGR